MTVALVKTGNQTLGPPRLTGNPGDDLLSLRRYLNSLSDDFTKVLNVGGVLPDHEIRIEALEKTQTRSLVFSIPGKPPAAQAYQMLFTETGTLVANSMGTQRSILVAPTATWIFGLSVVQAGIVKSLGQISIAPSGALTTPLFPDQLLAPGDSVRLTAPAIQDTTGSDIAIAFRYKAGG